MLFEQAFTKSTVYFYWKPVLNEHLKKGGLTLNRLGNRQERTIKPWHPYSSPGSVYY